MNGKRIILAIVVLAAVVLVSVAIFSVDWGGADEPVRGNITPTNITDLANTDTQVRMSVRGPIVADQVHQQLDITVGRDQTVGQLFNGFQGSVARTESTGNNETSYQAFLSALFNSQFTKQQLPPRGIQYDGACPNGNRYTFDFIGTQPNLPPSTWATSCGKKVGNFAGSLTTVRNLFEAQLPKAQLNALTTGTQF